MRVDARFIAETCKYWDDSKTQALLEALRVEMRRDLRKCSRNEAPFVESIIEQLDSKEFWLTLDWMMGYEFNP
jgi:hypothetical protein